MGGEGADTCQVEEPSKQEFFVQQDKVRPQNLGAGRKMPLWRLEEALV